MAILPAAANKKTIGKVPPVYKGYGSGNVSHPLIQLDILASSQQTVNRSYYKYIASVPSIKAYIRLKLIINHRYRNTTSIPPIQITEVHIRLKLKLKHATTTQGCDVNLELKYFQQWLYCHGITQDDPRSICESGVKYFQQQLYRHEIHREPSRQHRLL